MYSTTQYVRITLNNIWIFQCSIKLKKIIKWYLHIHTCVNAHIKYEELIK